ncbi:MAG: hypothetical protein DCC75_10095 [Proteobacteria bacterium]|nr:MAG: hypothetical protein DCC75_10095 [Pseudomonadota bacterium]
MNDVSEYGVSKSESLPRMDDAYLLGNGYDPVNELMRAIILRTIEDYHSKPEFRQEAIDYMFDEEEEYIFSFRAICRHLGMDPDKARFYIMNAKERISTRRRAA